METLNTPVAPIAAPPTPLGVQIRLSVMMFVQYAIQGAWMPLLFPFLNEYRMYSQTDVATILAAGAIGAMISPFLAGQLADRTLNSEHFLAISHLVGAIVVGSLAYVSGFYALVGLSFIYGVLYTPTLSVTNSVAFAHLKDRDRDFGKVRVWGTVGFIAAGIGIGQWLLYSAGQARTAQVAGMKDAFHLAAILGVVMGVFCLTLPKTPPRREQKNYAPGKALGEIRRQPLITLFLISFPVATVHAFFFARTSQFLGNLKLDAPWLDRIFGVGGAGLMTIGQISEILVLALMPVIARRVSRKAILTVGLLAYTVRFAVFAYLPYAWALVPALALHGLVFGCFFFIAYMVVDEETSEGVRASAQNLYNFIVFGAGVILGQLLTGWLGKWTMRGDQMNWTAFYAIPMWITIGCLAALLMFYPRKSRQFAGQA